jgi:Tetratricopeptide repeat
VGHGTGKIAGVVFVVDDLGAWLVGLLADATLKKLTTLVLGSDQERALRQAAKAAVERTAVQLAPSDDEQAQQLATAVGRVFRDPAPGAAVVRQATLLEALQAGIASKLAVLDEPDIIGIQQSSAQLPRVPGGMVAETLAGNLVREIMVRGSQGGPLAPLANQLNHDVTQLQGRRLEGMLAQLAGQVTALAQADSRPKAPRKPVRLAPRPVFLAGREELLAELGNRLAGDEGAGPRMAALYGLGGAGKTSVALEYAHRQLGGVGVAWQLPAENPTVLAAGFGELAAQLDAADRGDPVASVHSVLAASPEPWLLMFDNAPDRASVAPLVPPAGPGRVLITSRNQIWPPGQALEVPVLDSEVAAEFLAGRTGDPDRRAALNLAGELGGLPLALEQAAAYVQASGDSLAGYLASFLQRRPDLLGRGEPTGYVETVATTWKLAFEDLQQAAPRAAGLLRLLAFYAPEAIPVRRLLQPSPGLAGRLGEDVAPVLVPLLEDELAAGGAIAALRRYSLISPPAEGSVSVHRLVQAVTADQMPAGLASQWRQAAAALIEAEIPGDPQLPATWPTYAALVPHARAVLDLTSGGMWQIAQYLGYSGSYPAARDLSQLIADAYSASDAYGPEHRNTLSARVSLVRWTGEAGDAAGARDQAAALLPISERVQGTEHPETLTTRAYLASWTGAAGDAAGARDQFAALLPIRERVQGPEHPETLTTRAYLASWTGEAGDAAGARDQFAALLPIRARVLGPEHPGTLITRHDLAYWTGETGDAARARDQYAALLPIYERVLGPEHPDTLAIRHDLAWITREAGDAAAARDQAAALLPIRERVLGPEHPDTLATRSLLARRTGEAGDAAGARDQNAALLRMRERVLGPEHPETLATRSQLDRWTREAGSDPDTA